VALPLWTGAAKATAAARAIEAMAEIFMFAIMFEGARACIAGFGFGWIY
jgi:hypothetical protein